MCGDSRLAIVLVVLLSSSLHFAVADEHSHSVSTDCTDPIVILNLNDGSFGD